MGSLMSIFLPRRNSWNRQGSRGRGGSVAALQSSSANQSDNEAEVRIDGHDQSHVTLKNSVQVVIRLADGDESPMCMPEQALNAYLKALDIVISSLKEKWIPHELRHKGQDALDKATSRLAEEVHDSDYWDMSQIAKFIQELRRPQQGDVSFRDRCIVPSSENSSDSGSRSSTDAVVWDEPQCGPTDNFDKYLCRTSVLSLAGGDNISVVSSDSIDRLDQIVQRIVHANHHQKLSSLHDEHREKLGRCFDSHCDSWLTERSKARFSNYEEVSDYEEVSEASLSEWIYAFKVAVRVLQVMRKQFFKPGDDGPELDKLKQTYFTVVAEVPVRRFLSTARALTNAEWPADKISPMLLLMEAFDDMLPKHLPDLLPSGSAEMQSILKKMESIVGSIFDKMKIYVKNPTSHDPDADGTQEAAEDAGIHSSTKFVVKCMRLLSVHSTTVHRIFRAPDDDVNSLANQLTGVIDAWKDSLEKYYRRGATGADRPAFRLISLLNNVDWVSRNGEIAEEGLLVSDHLLKRHRENNERSIKELIDGYLEECWKPHVSCLTDRRVRQTAKARAKILQKFESDIYATLCTQAAWQVPDPKLRRKIRDAIVDLVIGPYKDFLGQSDGNAEEMEGMIYELFQGHVNCASLA